MFVITIYPGGCAWDDLCEIARGCQCVVEPDHITLMVPDMYLPFAFETFYPLISTAQNMYGDFNGNEVSVKEFLFIKWVGELVELNEFKMFTN